MPDKDGIIRTVPCDKVAIAKVMWGLIKAKLDHLRITNQADAYRKWCALMPHVMEGLVLPKEAAVFMPTTVEDFLQLYRFESANSEEGKHGSGYTPLHFATLSGNLLVARALLENYKADPHVSLSQFDCDLGWDKGCTPLHSACAVCPHEQTDEMVALLLRNGADPNRLSTGGFTPVYASVVWQSLPAFRALLKHAKDTLRLDIHSKINNASALGIAAYMSTPEIVEALLDAGANVAHVNDVRLRTSPHPTLR